MARFGGRSLIDSGSKTVPCVVFGTAIFVASNARAVPMRVELGEKVGASSANDPVDLGIGIGERVGVTFANFYAGLTLTYYVGGSGPSITVPNTNFGSSTTFSFSEHSLMYGVEAGYGITLAERVTVRAQLGIGNLIGTTTTSSLYMIPGIAPNAPNSRSNVFLEPGITALLLLGRLFLGADLNVLAMPGMENAHGGLSAHGQVGLVF